MRIPKTFMLGGQTITVETKDKIDNNPDIDGNVQKTVKPVGVLSLSGSRDEGDLIQTEALLKLRQKDTEYRYIFGRKGTGKTRLAKQLVLDRIANPLLVDESYEVDNIQVGLSTSTLLFKTLRDRYAKNKDYEAFWWNILEIGLTAKNFNADELEACLQRTIQTVTSDEVIKESIIEKVTSVSPKNFVIDGIETAFEPTSILGFISGLFSVMKTIQSDRLFQTKIKVILFLRTDLAYAANVQNIEQQTENRLIELHWDHPGNV